MIRTTVPRMSEQEAYALLEDMPGLEIDEDGWWHSYLTPEGLLRFEGVRLADEVFSSERYGLLNVSEALRNIPAGAQSHRLPLNAGLKENIRQREVDASFVRSMPTAQRDEPILMVVGPGGLDVIDGHHRLSRRIHDRLGFVDAFVLSAHALPHIRVDVFRRPAGGSWSKDGPVSDDQFKNLVAAAQRFEQEM